MDMSKKEILAVVALAGGLSAMTKAKVSEPDEKLASCLRRIDNAKDHALNIILPDGELDARDINEIADMIMDFQDKMWGGKEKNMQTYISFSSAQIEEISGRIKIAPTHKTSLAKRALSGLVDAENCLWEWFVGHEREYMACSVAGVRAADSWREFATKKY